MFTYDTDPFVALVGVLSRLSVCIGLSKKKIQIILHIIMKQYYILHTTTAA